MKKSVNKFNFPLKGKYVAMVAPSFVVDFPYPGIIHGLKKLGFDKVIELTFGAKLVNKEYHNLLKESDKLLISSVCPGIVDIVVNKFSEYKNNLIGVDSPMIATAKICKKVYPMHKIVFVSPCNYKKVEAKKSKMIDFVIDYKELKEIFAKNKVNLNIKQKIYFDKFYNDYTKVYPLSGGLSKTLHFRGILKKNQIKVIDGINQVSEFLKKPDKSIKFLDCTFCVGGCIGGHCVNSKDKINVRKKKILKYMKIANEEPIPENRVGLLKNAQGISFNRTSFHK